MRYFVSVMGDADYEAGRPAPAELYPLMGEYVEKELASGRLVHTGGLEPSRDGYEVIARDGVITVKDGPFAEAREVIGGYAIVEVADDEEVLAMTREFIEVHFRGGIRDVHCQIRRIDDEA